jgi:hypothetical protein
MISVNLMKHWKKILSILMLLYLLYLLKSVMGINISHRYTAPSVFKLPIKGIMHWS